MKFMQIILLFLIMITTSGSAQVNTEALRREPGKEGWTHSLTFQLGYSAGNTDLFNVRGNFRSDYSKGPNGSLFIVNFQKGEANQQLYSNKGFVHVRPFREMHPRYALEGFVQKEYNEFIALQDRTLAGGGLRLHLPWNPAATGRILRIIAHLGAGGMWEKEVTTAAPQDLVTQLIRSTNYLSMRILAGDRSVYTGTAYYQVDTANLQDYRVLYQGGFTFKIFRNLDFNTTLNYRFDNDPPANKEKTDFEVTNGFTVYF